jgi:hypothetical protein
MVLAHLRSNVMDPANCGWKPLKSRSKNKPLFPFLKYFVTVTKILTNTVYSDEKLGISKLLF